MADDIVRNKLGQFAKGHSGNRRGTPTLGNSFAEILEELLSGTIDEAMLTDTSNKKKLLVSTLIQAAINGDIKSLNTIMDRMEGKPIQTNINENYERQDLADLADLLADYHEEEDVK